MQWCDKLWSQCRSFGGWPDADRRRNQRRLLWMAGSSRPTVRIPNSRRDERDQTAPGARSRKLRRRRSRNGAGSPINRAPDCPSPRRCTLPIRSKFPNGEAKRRTSVPAVLVKRPKTTSSTPYLPATERRTRRPGRLAEPTENHHVTAIVLASGCPARVACQPSGIRRSRPSDHRRNPARSRAMIFIVVFVFGVVFSLCLEKRIYRNLK